MPWMQKKLPVARSEGLLVENVGNEIVAYDSATKEAHCLTPLAAAVFASCDGRTGLDGLIENASERFGMPVNAEQVRNALAQLEERNLLEGGARIGGISRRDMIRKSAVVSGVAVATPLISSVFAQPALAANSATCGPLLCCPCSTSGGLNRDDCCFIRNVTLNCQCVNAGGDTTKYCKPAGSAAPSNEFCAANTPGNAACAGSQAAGTACNSGV